MYICDFTSVYIKHVRLRFQAPCCNHACYFTYLFGDLCHEYICVQVYPGLDVRNIVEANEKEEINNWCDFGVSYCQKKFTVRPFHCLGNCTPLSLSLSLCVCVCVFVCVSVMPSICGGRQKTKRQKYGSKKSIHTDYSRLQNGDQTAGVENAAVHFEF